MNYVSLNCMLVLHVLFVTPNLSPAEYKKIIKKKSFIDQNIFLIVIVPSANKYCIHI